MTGIIDQQTVNVFVEEYGFEIPAAVMDLVVIHSDSGGAPESRGVVSGTSGRPLMEEESSDMLYLAFVPEDTTRLSDTRYALSLVNDTSLMTLYSIAFVQQDKLSGVGAGNCNPGSAVVVGEYTLKELDDIKEIRVQAVFYQKGSYTARPALDVALKVNPVALCKGGNYKQTRWFDGLACLRLLGKEPVVEVQEELAFFQQPDEVDPRDIRQAKRDKGEVSIGPRPQKQVVENVVEIDLHAGELLETMAGMENKDILEYQLDVFRQTLEEYKLRRGQKIVFIHGKGDGVLKQRIRWELQTKYKRFHHQDASFKQYGYGATMVTIK